MAEFLFLDMDDTILDFHKAERVAVERTLARYGIEPTQEVCALYSRINQSYWERLERKEVTQPQLQVGRFADLFAQLGVQADAAQCAPCYMENLGIGHYFMPGAEEAVIALSKKYKLYLASNGESKTQRSRIASAGIAPYFKGIFISGEIGINKPDKRFFDSCFAQIPGFDPARTIMVGDSLTSDVLGGKNAGIPTCWVNPNHKPRRPDIWPDYEIESITQLEALLETL